MALKGTMALKGKQVNIPFRSSNLTKVLMESLVRPEANLAVIGTVSPSPTDTEHSIATLKTVCQIAGYNENCTYEQKEEVQKVMPKIDVVVPPKKWTREQLVAFLQTANKGKFASLVETLPSSTTGKDVARWGPSQYNHFCGGATVGSQLQKFVRNETVRADKAAKAAKEARANA